MIGSLTFDLPPSFIFLVDLEFFKCTERIRLGFQKILKRHPGSIVDERNLILATAI